MTSPHPPFRNSPPWLLARARDDARAAALHARGIQVLRFSNLEVLQETDAVAEALWLACQQGRAAGRSPPVKLRPTRGHGRGE